jgi:hypothetical protein
LKDNHLVKTVGDLVQSTNEDEILQPPNIQTGLTVHVNTVNMIDYLTTVLHQTNVF